MRKSKAIIILIIFAVIIIIVLWGLTFLPKELTTILAAGFGYFVKIAYDKWKESETRIYEKKKEVYYNLIKPWRNLFVNLSNKDFLINEESIKEAKESAFEAMIYASDEVLRKYSLFRSTDFSGINPKMILVLFANILISIRKDLGYSNTKVSELELLLLFVNMNETERTEISELINSIHLKKKNTK